MEIKKTIDYLEHSFLKDLLKEENITDISYNGVAIYYQHNLLGRQKSSLKVSEEDVQNFLRQIANLCEKQFSYQEPKLTVSIGKYRLDATHRSIGRVNNEPSFSFSIRIAHERILDLKQIGFLNETTYQLLMQIIKSKQSLIIAGKTSSGKTELQKYLIKEMDDYTRIIVIDSVLELDQIYQNNPSLDLTIWMEDQNRKEGKASSLIQSALRNNPDWLVVAEARGEEMLDVLNSAMTGHPIIATLHAQDSYSIRDRMIEMIMMNDKNFKIDDLYRNINAHFHFYIYVDISEDEKGHINRRLSSIIYVDKDGDIFELYHKDGNKEKYQKLPKSALKILKLKGNEEKLSSFNGGDKNE